MSTMIKEQIMSGAPCNIRLAAQLMKNITEDEFMVIVGDICDELELEFEKCEDDNEYFDKFDKGLFGTYLDFSFTIGNTNIGVIFFRRNNINDLFSNKIPYTDLITHLENVS